MANVQKQIVQYDSEIRLTRYDENATLKEKREVILTKLRDSLDKARKDDQGIPTFDWFNQGSYEMGTGINPANGDYDIDVGLDFNISKSKYTNPVDLKELVYKALKDYTPLGTVVRRSCVTVKYQVEGELAYHVDLAVYACDNPDVHQRSLYLAKGKRHSSAENCFWEPADPKGLIEWVEKRFDGQNEDQFLRVIRCLKGWKSYQFDPNGNSAPHGIGITIAAGRYFRPEVVTDPVSKKTTFDDRIAMRQLVDNMINAFSTVPSQEKAGTWVERLSVQLPVRPGKDVFEKMSDGQMASFKNKLTELRSVLDEVGTAEDPVIACEKMRKVFGPRFPVPEKADTAQSRGPAISSSGTSA